MRTAGTLAGGRWLRTVALVAIVAWLAPLSAGPADFARYHSYQDLTAALKAAAAAHPDLAKLVSIGKTREGRDLWALEIANPAGTPVEERPALLVAANFEGDHVIGSELALYVADYLLGAYPSDAAVKQRLDNHVIYIVPRMNPDGAEQMFAPVKTGARANLSPFDADNDARLDEDGPEDLNKDGFITLMRVKDPNGPYMISPEDPRLMKKADPAKGETGGWALYTEGVDNDGDGFINEDGPGGTDLNRNFMHQYPYFQADAGPYMVSEAETRALLEYVIRHRNIAAILTFGESDNLIAPGRRGEAGAGSPINLQAFADASVTEARKVGIFPEIPQGFGRGMRFMGGGGGFPGGPGSPGGSGAQPPAAPTGRGMRTVQTITTVNAADVDYLSAIAAKYRELTGIRGAGVTRTPAGAFFEYGYFQYGVPSFSTPGWGLPGGGRPAAAAGPGGEAQRPSGPPAGMSGGRGRMPGAPGEGDGAATPEGIDLRLLQWMDAEKVDGFVAWTPFKHPTLGDVEIGGFKPYAATNPPASKIADLGAGHAKFVMYLTSLFPKVRIAKAEASALGGGIYRVKAEVENAGYLPTALAHAVVARSVKPAMVQLGVAPESIVSGSEKTTFITALAGSGKRQAFDWIIKGTPGTSVTLKVVSQKSGTDTATLKLQ